MEYKNIEIALTYSDVLLVPQYSDIKSRNEVYVGNALDNNHELSLPIVSAPMDTVTGTSMAVEMSKMGGLGIIHRYNTIEQQVTLVSDAVRASGNGLIGAAIGVTTNYLERAVSVFKAGARVICVDVAHGHHALVKDAISAIRRELGFDVHIMAGNVATLTGFNELSDWGADSVRCNIGGGSICSTRVQTGHGVPGLQTIFDCAKSDRDARVIADGGIRTSGDIVKALAAGADFVMLGSLLAGTDESPGEKVTTKHGVKKEYRGMASKKAQVEWRGKYSSNEGISTFINYKGPVENILRDLRNGLVSGLSYSGTRNITELQTRAKFIRQTTAGQTESSTHILLGA
jgi:IMP dehydrogenase